MQVTTIGYWGGYPAANSATSCYLVEEDNYKLLVDCGSGALAKLQQKIEIKELDAVVLSHYHQDHIADIGVLQYACLVQNTIAETTDVLPIFGHEMDEKSFQSLTHQYTEGVAYDPTQTLQLGPLSVEFLQTLHPVPCFAMKICSSTAEVVYTADTGYFEELASFAHGADLLITDTNFYKGMDGSGPGHMTSEEAATVAKKADVETLWLSHLPQFGRRKLLLQEAADVFNGHIKLADEKLAWRSDAQ
ncbi:MBL fold metallo-hydrolase [Halobacillus sp. A5]|uniref:MBL fold metallo-hydrolase n=1 Tax=Halobacillus sp. A5 TaxID=2880263 RepID=UPI0020A64951|nr:MBL fold metallo-hydrolase [Halobacillus sp. A5]MCP3026733.1 MBL fold metallo-hydrolase [Halobacillus sp. A5]